MAELLDLVCGPASPLPETHQRYRLVAHIASGGQAEVYRAVRLSGGVSSAPLTVKVFRLNDSRTRAEQLRSWDKGDAVLMDLNSRGVPGICRRADGFYGPAPHPPGQKPVHQEPEPYQVLDYLPGVNLREYVQQRGAGAAGALDAVGTLDTLVRALLALHHPADPGASPVVHMDVKPSNVLILPSGEARLIDFTGARYFRPDHITTIAYTREAGGPEAFSGRVGPAYDVHGFGAVAYYMVTGAFPRTESPQQPGPGDAPLPPWAMLRRHPVLDSQPALRDHLLAPLADRPEDRPGTEELTAWTARLADLVERSNTPAHGLYWGVSRSARVVGRAGVRSEPVAPAGDWQRVERLEQEVVELRAALSDSRPRAGAASQSGSVSPAAAGAASHAGAPPVPTDRPLWPDAPAEPATQRADAVHRSAMDATRPAAADPTRPTAPARPTAMTQAYDRTRVAGPVPPAPRDGGTRVMAGPERYARPEQQQRGVAAVPQAPRRPDDGDDGGPPAPPEPDRGLRPLPGARLDTLRRGMGLSVTGALFAFVCWGIWAIANRHAEFVNNLVMFVLALAIAVGLFALCRLVGRLVIEGMMHRSRASARLSHLAVGIYLVITGISFASRVSWINSAYNWIVQQIG
ncbi:MAG TPA: hypothetical protein VGN37_11345 [Actinocatenispora sp.]